MGSGLLVLRLGGTVNVSQAASETLRLLHLNRPFRGTIVPDTPGTRGMLRTVKDYIMWAPLSPQLAATLLEKRGMASGGKRLTRKDLKAHGFDGFEALGKVLAEGGAALAKLGFLGPSFALNPPRGGFKRGLRRTYKGRSQLGENPGLLSLIQAML